MSILLRTLFTYLVVVSILLNFAWERTPSYVTVTDYPHQVFVGLQHRKCESFFDPGIDTGEKKELIEAWNARESPSTFPGSTWNYTFPQCIYDVLGVHQRLDRLRHYTFWLTSLWGHRGEIGLAGVEIGALHERAPLPDGPVVSMKYVDGLSIDQLKLMYPELDAKNIQLPDIVDQAETLNTIKDQSFDFLIASHVLEHTQDVLFSIENWLRVVKNGGLVFITIPNMCATFDSNRSLTTFEHFLQEYQNSDALTRNKFEHFREWALVNQPFANITNLQIESIAKHYYERNYFIHYHTFHPHTSLQLFMNLNKCLGFHSNLIHYSWDDGQIFAVLKKQNI